MDFGFMFNVGGFVRMAISSSQDNTKSWNGTRHRETRGQILSRILEECPGGIQRHYLVRWTVFSGSMSSEVGKFLEHELVPSEPFPPIEENKKD